MTAPGAAVHASLLVFAVAIVVSFAGPARADGWLAYSDGGVGVVASASEPLVGGGASDIGAQQVAGVCSYTGQTTLSGTRQYQFGGAAVATTTSPSIPEVTDIKCTLTSWAQGLPGELPTQTASLEIGFGGPAASSASTITGWPFRPMGLCVDGYAIFGPTPVVTKQIIHACTTPNSTL